MSLFLDVATVIILALVIYRAYKKGMARVLVELVGYLASAVVAYLLSSPAGSWIFTAILKPVLMGNISETISQQAGAQLASQLSGFTRFFSLGGGNGEKIVNNAVKAGGNAVTATLMDTLVAPVLMNVGRMIAFVVIFALCLILVRIIARAVDIVFKIPLIRQLNELGGVAIGAVKAVLVMFVVCTLVAVAIPIFSMQKKPPITNNTIEQTYIFKQIYQVNPLTQLLLKK